MHRTIYLLVALISLQSCAARKNTISNHQAYKNNESVRESHKDAIASYQSYTSLQYIDRFKAIAVKEMNMYGIPASITLAQGLYESGSGNSELAKVANNHFGIKCNSTWTGKSYYKDDDNHNDCFRVYDNPEDSYRDHSNFLKRKNYIHLFELDKNDYKGWAYGLKAAGYATNPRYPEIIIGIIEKYSLYQYDAPEDQSQKLKREDKVLDQIDKNTVKAQKDSVMQAAPAQTGSNNLYTVQHGDTLYNISKRFGLTIDELKSLNNMADNNIKIGQQLVVTK